MSDYQAIVAAKADQIVGRMRRWEKEQGAKELMREYLSEEGYLDKSKTKLEELLDERMKLGLLSEDQSVKMKAIDSALAMATGNEKVTNVQNNQFNFGDFVDNLKE